MTQGYNGASVIQPDGLMQIPTVVVPEHKIVDSVGCGDVFTAALAYTYAKNRDLIAAIQAGHAAAGAKLLTASAA